LQRSDERVWQLLLEQREDPDGSTLQHWLSRQQLDDIILQGVLLFVSQHVERQLMIFSYYNSVNSKIENDCLRKNLKTVVFQYHIICSMSWQWSWH
jgi:hypothetical protein